jgi:hypothetical protein
MTAAAVETADNEFTVKRTARQDGKTNGDFVAIAEDAEISRGVGGDVYALGRNVIVTDDDKLQNIAVGGANVNVSVKDARNIYAAGADLNVRADNAAGVYLAGLGVTLTGDATDAYVVAGSAHIDGNIKENLVIRSDNVVFGDDATVGGRVTIYSKKHATLPDSIDSTRVTYKSPSLFGKNADAQNTGGAPTGIRRITLIFMVSGVVAAVLLSLGLNATRPEFFSGKADGFRRRVWGDLIRGLAAIIVLPVVAVALLFTVVGVPIGVLLAAAYAIVLYLAPVVTGTVLGRVIFKRMNRFASGAICVGILKILALIPWFGMFVSLAAALYGMGAVVGAVKFRSHERIENAKVPVEII